MIYEHEAGRKFLLNRRTGDLFNSEQGRVPQRGFSAPTLCPQRVAVEGWRAHAETSPWTCGNIKYSSSPHR